MEEPGDAMNNTLSQWITDNSWSEPSFQMKRNNSSSNPGSEYEMAAQVALGAAIIVALGILLALIWNTIKRRASGITGASRRSIDSMERLVLDRLRNRPPPYSMAEADKPPSYEESFNDPSSPPPSLSLAAPEQPDWIRPPTGGSRVPEASGATSNQRSVCYENQAFDRSADALSDEDGSPLPVPSISMVVDLNRTIEASHSGDNQSELMVHL